MDLLKLPGVYCEFKKGESIIKQGKQVDYVYYLVSGTCYRTTITEKGDEIIFGIKEASNSIHSLLGVLILYSDGLSTSHFIARSKCYCYKISKENFLDFVKDKPDILSQLLFMAMWELREVVSSFQARQEGKVANHLCQLLYRNAHKKEGKLLVGKAYSNTAISQFLGIHKVTVAKILKALKEEGIINKTKEGIIILDENKLGIYAKAEKTVDY